MRTFYSHYFNALNHMPLHIDDFSTIMHALFPDYSDLSNDTLLEVLIGLNAPLCRCNTVLHTPYNTKLFTSQKIQKLLQDKAILPPKPHPKIQNLNMQEMIDLSTKYKALNDTQFCFVDIETTSSNTQTGQIIELGALIMQEGKIIDTFDTFVYAQTVPETITHLTGIDAHMLKHAPKLEVVLQAFKSFIKDCVFVAHNVAFDYEFIAASLESCGIPRLLNARLCTLEFSRKTLLSKKHSLPHLNKMLGINTAMIHRAFADALTSMELFNICMLSLPSTVTTLQDLIDFTKGKMTYPQRATSNTTLHKTQTKYKL